MRNLYEKLKEYVSTRDERALKRSAIISTVMFSLLLVWVLFFKLGISKLIYQNYINISQFTFKERFLYDIIPFNLHNINITNQILDIICNCFVFAPFGVFFRTLFFKKNLVRDLSLCFFISLAAEITQLFTMLGGFATVDLITNTIGCLVGTLFYEILLERMKTEGRVRFYRIINLIMLPIMVYAIYTFVNNFELIMAVLTRSI